MSSNREQTDNRLVSVREVERSSNSEEIPIASQPRPPRNLQDLLRYSTEAANLPGHESNENCLQTLSEEVCIYCVIIVVVLFFNRFVCFNKNVYHFYVVFTVIYFTFFIYLQTVIF